MRRDYIDTHFILYKRASFFIELIHQNQTTFNSFCKSTLLDYVFKNAYMSGKFLGERS